MTKAVIGALIFPGFELLDLYGPLEMFGLLTEAYEIRLVAISRAPIASNQGPRAIADRTLDDDTSFDIILVPGGMGTRVEVENPVILEWIARKAKAADTILSVCTGAALLAKAGLLENRRATTNKMAWAWATSHGTAIDWRPRSRWVKDGHVWTSSGISAGIDMSLAVIAARNGPEIARDVANWAEYRWLDDPADDQFAALHGL